MIASASYAPLGLRQIEGTHLVNRAPDGSARPSQLSPNSEELDAIENLAIDRAGRPIFGAEYVNVQALSSTIANVRRPGARSCLPKSARFAHLRRARRRPMSVTAPMRHITGREPRGSSPSV